VGIVETELRGKTIYVLLLFSVLLITLGYQVKIPFEIELGEQGNDSYLRNFYDIETADDLSYRWSSDRSSVLFPGLGGHAPALLRLRLNGWRPADLPPPVVSLKINGHELASFAATHEFETYEFAITRGMTGISGDLVVEIDSEFFVPHQVTGGGDLRQLGVLVERVSVEHQGSPTSIVTPAPLQMIYLVGGVLALYLLARCVVSRRGAVALIVPVLIGLSLTVALGRISLASYSYLVLVIPGLGVLIVELAQRGPTLARGIALATALVLATVLGVKRFMSISSLAGMGIAPDLANNYSGAQTLRSGGMIYSTNLPLFVGYDNPPLTAVLMMPLTLVDLQAAITLFFSLNVAFLLTTLALIYAAKREYLLRYPYWLVVPALVLNLDPVFDSMLLGQLDLVILLLIVLCYWAYRNDRDILAGCSLGLAAMVKLSPVMLILYFLLKREYRVFISALVAGLIVGTLSLAAAGVEAHVIFITRILPTLLAGSAQMENQSLNGFFNRLFLGPSFTTELAQVPSLPQVRILTLLASLVLVGTAAFLVRERLASRHGLRFDLEFSLVVVLLPLISSIAWHHYMTWYILPFLLLLNPRLRDRLPRRTYLVLATIGFSFYATLCIPIGSYPANLPHGPGELLLSVRLYGALAFYGILAYLLARYPSRRHPVRESGVIRQDGAPVPEREKAVPLTERPSEPVY
jgi:alpha-1,2-mannosyltransferase